MNVQVERVQFTIEYEDESKSINFLDTTIINNKQGSYDFKVHRKDTITNVQIQPTSSVEPKTVAGVFKGFLTRAKRICSPQYLDHEIEFLKSVFIEDGYNEDYLNKIIKNHMTHRTVPRENNIDYKNTVTLPWTSSISTKLKKAYKNLDIHVVFKSTSNLSNILCNRNKSKLPKKSNPDVYVMDCKCGSRYVGKIGASIKKHLKQHQRSIFLEKFKESGLSEHVNECGRNIDEDQVSTLSCEPSFFRRSIRESLEIQCLGTIVIFSGNCSSIVHQVFGFCQ